MLKDTKKLCATVMAACLVVSAASGLGGCAQTNLAASQTSPNDPCYNQRVALGQQQEFFAGDIVKGALIGAAGGALTGFLVGGNARSAAIGAGAGAIAGGVAGYYSSLQNRGGSRSDLISQIVGDTQKEQQELDKTQIAFNNLVSCRRDGARQVNADLRGGRISRPQAETQMASIRSAAQDDIRLVKQINARVDERTGNYVYATEQATGAPIAQGPGPSRSGSSRAPARAPSSSSYQSASTGGGDDAAARQSCYTLVQKKQQLASSTTQAENSIPSTFTVSG